MKRSVKLLILCFSIIASNAIAADSTSTDAGRYYFELGAGLSNGYVPMGGELPSGRYSGAAVYSFAVGKQLNEHIAMEVELAYRGDYNNNDPNVQTSDGIEKGNVNVSSLTSMLNGYYYYYNQIENFKPYVIGGAGIARNNASSMVISGDIEKIPFSRVNDGAVTTSFAWKFGLGAKYSLDRNFDVDLRYQFVNLGSVDLGNSASDYLNGRHVSSDPVAVRASRLQAHEFLVGIVYKF